MRGGRRAGASRVFALVAAAWWAAACGGPTIETSVAPPYVSPRAGTGPDAKPTLRVTVDRAAREVVLDMGPFNVPVMGGGETEQEGDHPSGHGAMHGPEHPAGHGSAHGPGHGETSSADDAPDAHGAPSALMPFEWPLDGWMQGFQVRVMDGAGQELPRHILHHMIGVNFDRRQLAYPIAERFFGIGTETADVALPGFLGVPMTAGQRLGLYASWHNDTGRDLGPVYVRVVMDYTPRAAGADVQDVLPAYFDTDFVVGGDNMWDVPPGWSERSWEFTVPVSGGLLAATGHLHDYGQHVRLEDARSGEVLVRLDGRRDADGRLVSVETRYFRKWLGLRSDPLRLEAGRRYRVVGTYHNPLEHTIVDGAMAHIVGIFAPDDMGEWPELDAASDLVERDLRTLPAAAGHGGHRP